MNPKVEKYHFIGIGGVGMSALARILLEKKIPVSGSDLASSEILTDLKEKGALIRKGHSASYISALDTVVYSTDIKIHNPEFQAAKVLKCKMMHRSELLAHLMKDYQTFVVTGTHGKTTTTALLTRAFMQGGLDPTFAVGGHLNGSNGKLGKGSYFVAEADESDGSFLNYNPQGAIITNIEKEHLDFYKTEEALLKAFDAFAQRVRDPSLLFYCEDDSALSKLMSGRGTSYGFSKTANVHICNYRQVGFSSFFDVHFEGKVYAEISLALGGKHNALNAAAVFGLSLKIGMLEADIREAFKTFPGVARRCQKRKEVNNVIFFDDYGHHPTEIKVTLASLREAIQERRLIAIFQPHRYSRTQLLLEEFGKAFEEADFVFVTDIYGAREQPIDGLTAQNVLEQIRKFSKVECEYLPKEKWQDAVSQKIRPHDVVITFGAGDITHFHNDDCFPKKYVVGLLFGGLSCEHEISLRSSRFVLDSLNKDLYDIILFGIDKKGKWIVGKEAETILQTETCVSSNNATSFLDPKISSALESCDIFLPILHGTYGEDGTLQGFFEMLGKPYIGPDTRAAAISMDKVLTKKLVESAGVPTPKDVSFSYVEWKKAKETVLEKILMNLAFPVFVKPVHLGSSVGITKVESTKQLEGAISYAFQFDFRVMVEEGKIGCRELEFAVVGNTDGYDIIAPGPGEKLAEGHFVDYEKKYGKNSVQTTLSPDLEPAVLKRGQELAVKAFKAVGASGMTRVDFLLDPRGNYWLFEMNPIPGLQKLSLFPKIWMREGVTGDRLFDRLIILALQRRRQQNRHFQTL